MQRFALWLVPRLFVLLIKLWFRTCRVETGGQEFLTKIAQNGNGIAVFWHYSFVYSLYALRTYSAAVMVSTSSDGEYVARAARLLGHLPIRGSSNRKGMQALRKMIQAVRDGYNCGMVADGSQGPPRKLQPGCILIASKSGRPILPVVWAARRYVAFQSWDRTVVPLPFTRIVLLYGAPMVPPPDLDANGIEQYREKLEQQMNQLYRDAWRRVGRAHHDGID